MKTIIVRSVKDSMVPGFFRASFLLLITTALAVFGEQARPLEVSSQAFDHNGNIPSEFTCDGEDINPGLIVRNVPLRAKTLAIVMHDPDAPGGFDHWIAWNILAGDSNMIAQNSITGIEGKNSSGKNGYKGPCPPEGKHHYHFLVYALDRKLSLKAGSDRKSLERAMKGHILSQGELVGTYRKKSSILE